jgi:hypothetical protein
VLNSRIKDSLSLPSYSFFSDAIEETYYDKEEKGRPALRKKTKISRKIYRLRPTYDREIPKIINSGTIQTRIMDLARLKL